MSDIEPEGEQVEDLEVDEDEAAAVKGGARHTGDPCDGGE